MFLDRSAPNKNAIKVLDFVISFIVVDQPSFIPIPTWANLSGANVIMKFQALLLNMVFWLDLATHLLHFNELEC